MSNLPGNPHAQKFVDTEAMAEGKRYSPEIARVIQAAQQMEATMALAYEQRTANLIAVATAVSENGVYHLDPALIGAAQEELAKRLGLGDTK